MRAQLAQHRRARPFALDADSSVRPMVREQAEPNPSVDRNPTNGR